MSMVTCRRRVAVSQVELEGRARLVACAGEAPFGRHGEDLPVPFTSVNTALTIPARRVLGDVTHRSAYRQRWAGSCVVGRCRPPSPHRTAPSLQGHYRRRGPLSAHRRPSPLTEASISFSRKGPGGRLARLTSLHRRRTYRRRVVSNSRRRSRRCRRPFVPVDPAFAYWHPRDPVVPAVPAAPVRIRGRRPGSGRRAAAPARRAASPTATSASSHCTQRVEGHR